MKKYNLSIIIVNFNTKKSLEACLKSIFENPKSKNFEIIVVDNNSSDQSVSMIQTKFPQVILVKNKENIGFAKAVNQGLKIAKHDFYLLLNPDTLVKGDAIEKLLNFARSKSNLAALGAKLLNPDGSVQSSCYNLPSIKNAILEFWFAKKGAYEKFAPESKQPVEVEAIVGAVMLIPKTAVEKIGLFDERYFMYFEDLDWCSLARKHGLKIYWCPQSEIIHLHGIAASQNSDLAQKRLIESSRIYNGNLKFHLLNFIILLGLKFRK